MMPTIVRRRMCVSIESAGDRTRWASSMHFESATPIAAPAVGIADIGRAGSGRFEWEREAGWKPGGWKPTCCGDAAES